MAKTKKNKIISIGKASLMAENYTIDDGKKWLDMAGKTLPPQKMLERAAKTNNLLVSTYIRLKKGYNMWERESKPYLNNFIFSGELDEEVWEKMFLYGCDAITENITESSETV